MNRRGFLRGIIAACAAPAIITTPGLLMPVRSIAIDQAPALKLVRPEFLTLEKITREALIILHQKASFIGSINSQYDDQFAAKVGGTLRIRLPLAYGIGAA